MEIIAAVFFFIICGGFVYLLSKGFYTEHKKEEDINKIIRHMKILDKLERSK